MYNKMTKMIMLFVLFITFPLANLFAEVMQYENQLVQKIDVIIANQPVENDFDCKPILARMSTKSGKIFSQAEFDNDLKTLSQDYDRLEPQLESVDERIFITMKVWPKPIIRSLKFCGNEKIKSKKLQKEIEISAGSVFDRIAFNKAFHKLKAYYIKKGYFEAHQEYLIVPVPDCNEVDVEINITEGRSGRISEIRFFNFEECEEHDILELMVTKKYNAFTSWMTQEGTYNEDAILQDEFSIINYLQNEGYADAKVKIEVRETKNCLKIALDIMADRGEYYETGCITFKGNTLFTDDEIIARFKIHEGDAYSPEKLRDTIKSITDLYGKNGYIDAYVNFETQSVEGKCAFDVNFVIEEGQQYRVGMIKVFGNIATQTRVILHETLLVPGEVFNTIKLQQTELKLGNIGYFKHVNVYAVKSNEESLLGENYRDVHIEVEETNTGNFSLFMGYSTSESLFGGINITEKNFNYKGFNKVFSEGYRALRGAGEYAHITASIGSKSSSYVLSWTKPFFNDTKWTVGFDLSKTSNSYISKDYNINSYGLTVHAGFDINNWLRFSQHYRIKNSTVSTNGHASHMLKEEAHIHGLISAYGIAFIYDSTDSAMKATKGLRSKLELEYAGLGGDHSFASFGYLNSYYYGIGSRSVFKLRGDWKFIQPLWHTHYDTMPLDERLFLGDETLVRGYRAYKLGPVFPHKDPRGGLSEQFYSAELSRRIFSRMDAFVFFDAGSLTKETWNFGYLYTSVGYGARIKLLDSIPPLTLGMGYPLNPKEHNQVKKFFLSVGGRF